MILDTPHVSGATTASSDRASHFHITIKQHTIQLLANVADGLASDGGDFTG